MSKRCIQESRWVKICDRCGREREERQNNDPEDWHTVGFDGQSLSFLTRTQHPGFLVSADKRDTGDLLCNDCMTSFFVWFFALKQPR